MKTKMLNTNKLFAVFTLLMFISFISHATQKNVLMVISGYGNTSTDDKQMNAHMGYEFDEFAKAYLVFEKNNIKVDVASPQGGLVVASKYNPKQHFNQSVLSNADAMQSLEKSIAFSDINTQKYDGVFVVGGNGAMFDLPNNIALQKIIKEIYENNGSVAAVCHGPAALVNVKLSNGNYLVDNKKINSFTNLEEQAFNDDVSKNFAFMLENKLKQRGANFENASILLPHSVMDQRVITGQNQHSTGDTAVNLLRSIGLSNIKQPNFIDEQTMALVQRYLAGDNRTLAIFNKNPEQYQAKLVGMYAHFYAKINKDQQAIEQAVTLMEMVKPHWQHHKLSLSLAKNLVKLGRITQARELAMQVLKQQPEPSHTAHKKAKALLSQLAQASQS